MAVDISSNFSQIERDKLEESSQIQAMFSGSIVFVTGGTGFLGKLLIEKLLRSCSNLDKLYLLGRSKKNKTITERLHEQFNNVVYDMLRNEFPDFMQKIFIIEGDIAMMNLGISDVDRNKLTKEVEFIFHGAATVRFDEALKRATEINVRGTRDMIKLAKSCSKLRAFVHISSAYSNCVDREIEERFYEVPMTPELLINLAENLNDKTLTSITPVLVGDHPNTYTYTKAIAENAVKTYGKSLPIAIYRPAVLVSTSKEPVSAWTDNFYGLAGVVAGSIGLTHVLNIYDHIVADLVPADLVTNACIAIAWKTARDSGKADETLIYNYVSSVQKPITLRDFIKYTTKYGRDFPPLCALWYCVFYMTNSRTLYAIFAFLFHWIPAYIWDGIAVILGRKPTFRKTYLKIEKMRSAVDYFATQNWKFYNNNIQNLNQELNNVDKKIFDFDLDHFSWDTYLKSYYSGIRLYLLKESPETIEQAKKKQIKLFVMHNLLVTILFLTLCWCIIITSRIFCTMFVL